MSCVEQVLYRRQIVPMTAPQQIETAFEQDTIVDPVSKQNVPDPDFFNGRRYHVASPTELMLPAAKHCRGMKSVFLVTNTIANQQDVDDGFFALKFVPTDQDKVWNNGHVNGVVPIGLEYALESDGFRWFVSIYKIR